MQSNEAKPQQLNSQEGGKNKESFSESANIGEINPENSQENLLKNGNIGRPENKECSLLENEVCQDNNMQKETTKKPVCMLAIGMAGTGKTTLVQRINAHLSQHKRKRFVINLDPAVIALPYNAHIDIRDTVDYAQVMKQYKLGPNGAILTSLNLFTTKFNQVLDIVDSKQNLEYIILDTPGQIEIFTWSASGSIITDSISSTYPTVVLYIIDTPRCTSPTTFMSNMLYAVSILYKTKLPFVLVFNKIDVHDQDFAVDWMTDFECFQEAVAKDESYMGTLAGSMCLVLEEFYKHLKVVGVSAITGEGMDELFEAIDEAVVEYESEYLPHLNEQKKLRREREEIQKQTDLSKLLNDLKLNEDPEVA